MTKIRDQVLPAYTLARLLFRVLQKYPETEQIALIQTWRLNPSQAKEAALAEAKHLGRQPITIQGEIKAKQFIEIVDIAKKL